VPIDHLTDVQFEDSAISFDDSIGAILISIVVWCAFSDERTRGTAIGEFGEDNLKRPYLEDTSQKVFGP
jgi:hypothetical protein